MKEIPRITEAEWEVMKVLWNESPNTASRIAQELADSTNWKLNTVKTLISRLVSKKAVGYDQDGKSHYYFPLVNEDECVKAEGETFLKRVYGGALKPMLVNFLREKKLSSKEIEELKAILEEGKAD
ncbi:MAG: BlaI/MecI/CopY family transcriptional regulator [Firmicutes bacterium]|nr:BlaI/MecI/CopY family transcriptional regulator [Bacillota bacterium]